MVILLKKMSAIMVFVVMFLPVLCGSKIEAKHLGVNAEIIEINKEINGMVVKGLDSESILGEVCYINCENPDINIIYYDDTGDVIKLLDFKDLQVGDKITLDIDFVENKYTMPLQIQLLTERN